MKINQILLSALLIGSFPLLHACGGGAGEADVDGEKEEEPMAQADQNPSSEEAEDVSFAEFEFEETSHNFGEVRLGETVEKRFEFTNTGEEPLVILEADAGCGCTVPDYSEEPIAPGEQGFVDVKYDSENQPLQHFQQSVRVLANVEDGEERLSVSGNLVGPDGSTYEDHDHIDDHGHDHNHDHGHAHGGGGSLMEFEKTEHDFGTVELGAVVSHRFEFVNMSNEPMEIEDVEAYCGCTVPEYSEGTIEPGEEGFVKVNYDTEAREVSYFNQAVTITTSPDDGEVNLFVEGEIPREF